MRNILLFIFLFCNCFPKFKGNSAEIFHKQASNEKIYIAPIVNNAQFEFLPGWPNDPIKEKLILDRIASIELHLKDSLKQADCIDTFFVDEITSHPSLRVSVIIQSASLKKDTLSMPLLIEIERISDGMIKEYRISSFAFVSDYNFQNPLYFEQLFTNYLINFPYSSVINLICSN